VVDQFFDDLAWDEGNIDADVDEVDPIAESEPEANFNPPRANTQTFIQQASSASDMIPASASMILQPSPLAPPFASGTTLVPQPLSSSMYEVSRHGSRSANLQMQSNIMGLAELMLHQQQQQMEEDQHYRLQRERERNEERREEWRQREEDQHHRDDEQCHRDVGEI
jgi:hypothetical protein